MCVPSTGSSDSLRGSAGPWKALLCCGFPFCGTPVNPTFLGLLAAAWLPALAFCKALVVCGAADSIEVFHLPQSSICAAGWCQQSEGLEEPEPGFDSLTGDPAQPGDTERKASRQEKRKTC